MSVGDIADKENVLVSPETSVPIDTVLDNAIVVAGVNLDVRAIYDQFKQTDKFTRQDVKDFIKANEQKISGLEDLRKAIQEKRGTIKAKRIIVDVYDEIIDKMVTAEWMSFHTELSPEFERQLVKEWAKTTV